MTGLDLALSADAEARTVWAPPPACDGKSVG